MVAPAVPKREHPAATPAHLPVEASMPGRSQQQTERTADGLIKNMANNGSFAEAPFLKQLAVTLGEPSAQRGDWAEDDISRPQGRVLTLAEAHALAARIASSHVVPAHYTFNGCESRAHIICDLLHKEGIACAKAFADSQGDGRHPAFKARGETMEANWTYHVAPVVYVRDARGQVSVRVIDPSFSPEPLEVAAWIGMFRNGAQVTVDLARDAQYKLREKGEKPQTFASNLAGARESIESERSLLASFYQDQPGSTAIGPVSKIIARDLEKSLQLESLIEKRYQPLLKNPRVTEVLSRTPDEAHHLVNKTTVTYTLPSASIALELDKFGPFSSEASNRLTDNATIATPAGVTLSNLDGRSYGNQLIFEARWRFDPPKK